MKFNELRELKKMIQKAKAKNRKKMINLLIISHSLERNKRKFA
jgi:hypothetical protein